MLKRYITLFFIVFFFSQIPLNEVYAHESKVGESDWYVGANMYRFVIDIGQKNGLEEIIAPTEYEGVGFVIGVVPFHDVLNTADVGFEFSYLENGSSNSAGVCLSSHCINAQSNLEFQLWTADTIVSFPISSGFKAFGSVGIAYITYDIRGSINYSSTNNSESLVSASKSGDGGALSIGGGVEYRPHGSNFSGKIKYTNFTELIKSDNNSDLLTISLNYYF